MHSLNNNKINFLLELWHNSNNFGHNIEQNGSLLKSIIGKNLSIIGQGLIVDITTC